MNSLDLSRRSAQPELMDEEDLTADALRATFRELAAINRLLGGHAATLGALDALVPDGTKRLRVLDVGCGDGEAAAIMLDWARARGMDAEVHGIDRSASTVRLAQEKSRPGLTFTQDDLFHHDAARAYDIVHAGLMLHHCPGDKASDALAAMYARARLGVAVNDLHRHGAAYRAIKLLTRLASRDRFIRHDAPVSVLRGFTRRELTELCRQAGLPRPDIRWRWAFRWQLTVRR